MPRCLKCGIESSISLRCEGCAHLCFPEHTECMNCGSSLSMPVADDVPESKPDAAWTCLVCHTAQKHPFMCITCGSAKSTTVSNRVWVCDACNSPNWTVLERPGARAERCFFCFLARPATSRALTGRWKCKCGAVTPSAVPQCYCGEPRNLENLNLSIKCPRCNDSVVVSRDERCPKCDEKLSGAINAFFSTASYAEDIIDQLSESQEVGDERISELSSLSNTTQEPPEDSENGHDVVLSKQDDEVSSHKHPREDSHAPQPQQWVCSLCGSRNDNNAPLCVNCGILKE
jgi:hypothetical protein